MSFNAEPTRECGLEDTATPLWVPALNEISLLVESITYEDDSGIT